MMESFEIFNDMSEYDTVVIGAGAAGLAAGRALATAGQRVAIVEARDRIGGRIFTRRAAVPGAREMSPIELGAEFIHGLPAETWALIEEGGLETYELQGSELSFTDNRLQNNEASHNAAIDVLERLTHWVQARPENDLSFADYLARAGIDAAEAEAAAAYVEGFNAADRAVIGAAALAKQQRAEDEIQGDRLFHVRGGYDRILQILARGIERTHTPVLLDRPVRQVTWSEGRVSVHTQDAGNVGSTLHAKRAVITLPLGVLHAGSIRFDPEPATLMAHARRMRMGTVVRATLVFDSRFWCDDDLPSARSGLATDLKQLSFLFTAQLTPSTWWTEMPEDSPIITGWVAGPKAETLQNQLRAGGDPDMLLTVWLRSLSLAFGVSERALARRLTSWHAHDWSSDEHARGAYSYVPAGALDASDEMSIPVAGTLYFAGEHTDTSGHWGTVHGALRSGLRAARQVLRDGGPR
jgi:monoamine oxidase